MTENARAVGDCPGPVVTPRLGDVVGARTRCSLEVGAGFCDQPGVAHIIWDTQMENGVTCAEHLPIARQFAYFALHDLAWACTLPGSQVLFEENTCVMPDGTDPLTLLAEQEVPVDA